MIQKVKALAADVDMTLSAKGSPLPEITIKAFEELHRKGVKLGLATGREITNLEKRMGRNWGLSFEFDFIVGMNGGMVYDRHTNHLYSMDFMSVEEMKDILHYLWPMIEKDKIAVSTEGNGLHNAMNIDAHLLDSARRHGFTFVDKTGDIEAFCERPVYKFLFRTTKKNTAILRNTIQEHYKDKYQTVETFPGTIEIMFNGINKGNGLKMYAEWNQIDTKHIISFGDNENDNSLLEVSGWGVCLKDGNPKTKAIADTLTDYDCLEGGVGHYLYDHILNNKDVEIG